MPAFDAALKVLGCLTLLLRLESHRGIKITLIFPSPLWQTNLSVVDPKVPDLVAGKVFSGFN